MRLSKNLERHEMACECGCGFDTVDTVLVEILQHTVDFFEKTYNDKGVLVITGGNRCHWHTPRSQHLYGRAADFKIFVGNKEQVQPREVMAYLNDQWGDVVSIGLYSNRLHLDTRTDGGKRWRSL